MRHRARLGLRPIAAVTAVADAIAAGGRSRRDAGDRAGRARRRHAPQPTVVVRGRRQGERCVIEVADDGVGLDPDEAAVAFDRFWRGDPARQRQANGSGLGLSIVRAIVEASGGRVALDSALGRGTTVRVVLPAA